MTIKRAVSCNSERILKIVDSFWEKKKWDDKSRASYRNLHKLCRHKKHNKSS